MPDRQIEAGDGTPRGKRLTPARITAIVVLIGGFAAFFAFGLHHHITPESLKEHRYALTQWVAEYGIWAIIAFAGVYALAIAFSVPGGAVMTIAAGFLFGPYVATATVVGGATVGATALFLAARFALGDCLKARAGPFLARIEAGFNENGMSYMFVLRLVPLFPFWLVNLAPAFLGVPLRTFVISTLFGIIPGTFVYALLGDGAGMIFDKGGDLDLYIVFEPRVLAPIVGLAILACIPIAYKKWKR